jgi:membrane protein required for colicin V production
VTLFDFLVVIILGASIAAGFTAGFVRVGIEFMAAIFGVLCGFWYYGRAAAWVHKYVQSMTVSNLLGFFLIFFAFLLLGALVGKLLARLFRAIGLGWLDRVLGAALGFVRGSLIVVALVAVAIAFVPKPMPNWIVNSKSLPYAIDGSHAISQLAPEGIKDAFRDSMLEIRQTWRERFQKARKKLEPGLVEDGKTNKNDKDPPEDRKGPRTKEGRKGKA